jgi:uncharacterized protein YwqG
MTHERFDLARWEAEFPLARLRDDARRYLRREHQRGYLPQYVGGGGMSVDDYIEQSLDWYIFAQGPSPHCAEMITGPYTIAAIEQLRRERAETLSSMERVLTDIFVFGRGEPARREVTKIGGLPYWPAHRPWPRAADGDPMTFIAQFNFADSRDITGPLPGDLLLIYGRLGYVLRDEMIRTGLGSLATEERHAVPAEATMHFEWLSLGEDNLVDAATVPPTDWPILPCYGQIHRTFDYEIRESTVEVDEDIDDFEDEDEDEDEHHICVLNATKIGGIPYTIQADPRWYHAGRHLATLAETRPDRAHQYPYVNVVEPLGSPPGPEDQGLTWGDCGLMYLFLEPDGQVGWHTDGS